METLVIHQRVSVLHEDCACGILANDFKNGHMGLHYMADLKPETVAYTSAPASCLECGKHQMRWADENPA